ncbi:MAG: ATP-dependent protease La domain-containing protein [Acidimicrobiia bacterium]|nr:ATP-dependent protease La domain-containing protein [Acidimicrobiia bacterium]
MHEELLPLFPLSVVLLPGTPLPLHIFEERYKEMIGEVMAGQSEFGVVLASQEGIAQAGCTATVEEVVQQYPDGRMDIVTYGRRRFSIQSLDDERAYLRANVNFFDDEEANTPATLRRQAMEACSGFQSPGALDAGQPLLSFHLAASIEDLPFKQSILQSRSEADRLRRLIAYAPKYERTQSRIRRLRETAPRNGHSQLPGSWKEDA